MLHAEAAKQSAAYAQSQHNAITSLKQKQRRRERQQVAGASKVPVIMNLNANLEGESEAERCGRRSKRMIQRKRCDNFQHHRQSRASSLRSPLVLLSLLVLLAAASVQLASCKSTREHSLLLERFRRQDADSPDATTESTEEISATATTTAAEPEASSTMAATTTTTTTTTAAPAPSNHEQRPAKSKVPPVNFTLVDELFREPLDDEAAVLQKWRHMDRQMTDGVRSVLKMIFPHVVAMSTDAKVSGACSGAILKWILNLRNLRTWAVKMLDATGKPGAGLLEGALTMFGNYKQCVHIRAPDEDEIELADGEFREYFRGQYCVLELKPYLPRKRAFYSLNSTIAGLMRKSVRSYEKSVYDELSELAMAFNFVSVRADLCVPSLCSRDDMQRVADFLSKHVDMRAKVQRCDVMPQEGTGDSRLDDTQIVWALVFALLLLLVIASSLCSALLGLRAKRSKSRVHSLATAMSIQRSLSHMKSVQVDRINDSKPAFLYTLRLVLVLWFCLVTLTSQLEFQFLRELLGLRDIIMLWPMQLVVNSSLLFDSIILLTAFTYSYQNINSNLTDLVKYNVSKYSRLMPSIMLMVAVVIMNPFFHKYLSPVWHDFVDKPAQVCKSSGWLNVFFLQNLLSYDQICLPHTWLFCVELQLCLLTIPIVYMLNKNFDTNHGRFRLLSFPIMLLVAMSVGGALANMLTVYSNQLPAAWFETFPDKDDRVLYFSVYLAKTWAHLVPFAVGLFAGHLCRCQSIDTFSGRPYGRKCCDTLMLTTSAIIMTALIFGLHSWSLSGASHLDAPVLSALYAGAAPLLWSVSWALILFQLTVPDSKNQQCALARLLTFDSHLIRLGRLSFLAYLIFPYVNQFVLATQEQAIFSSLLMLGHTFLGNLVTTFVLAIVISALLELPCRRLIKKLALGSRRQCTNLGIIARQLNNGRQQTQGPAHDPFSSRQAQKQHAAQEPMIPLK